MSLIMLITIDGYPAISGEQSGALAVAPKLFTIGMLYQNVIHSLAPASAD